jgi:hypothetical protein
MAALAPSICPCCGGRIIVVETFEGPRPAPRPMGIWRCGEAGVGLRERAARIVVGGNEDDDLPLIAFSSAGIGIDLTPAEAHVARSLASGKTVEDIAADGGVSLSTVRKPRARHIGEDRRRSPGQSGSRCWPESPDHKRPASFSETSFQKLESFLVPPRQS